MILNWVELGCKIWFFLLFLFSLFNIGACITMVSEERREQEREREEKTIKELQISGS